jgi:hypothetical protein
MLHCVIMCFICTNLLHFFIFGSISLNYIQFHIFLLKSAIFCSISLQCSIHRFLVECGYILAHYVRFGSNQRLFARFCYTPHHLVRFYSAALWITMSQWSFFRQIMVYIASFWHTFSLLLNSAKYRYLSVHFVISCSISFISALLCFIAYNVFHLSWSTKFL